MDVPLKPEHAELKSQKSHAQMRGQTRSSLAFQQAARTLLPISSLNALHHHHLQPRRQLLYPLQPPLLSMVAQLELSLAVTKSRRLLARTLGSKRSSLASLPLAMQSWPKP